MVTWAQRPLFALRPGLDLHRTTCLLLPPTPVRVPCLWFLSFCSRESLVSPKTRAQRRSRQLQPSTDRRTAAARRQGLLGFPLPDTCAGPAGSAGSCRGAGQRGCRPAGLRTHLCPEACSWAVGAPFAPAPDMTSPTSSHFLSAALWLSSLLHGWLPLSTPRRPAWEGPCLSRHPGPEPGTRHHCLDT